MSRCCAVGLHAGGGEVHVNRRNFTSNVLVIFNLKTKDFNPHWRVLCYMQNQYFVILTSRRSISSLFILLTKQRTSRCSYVALRQWNVFLTYVGGRCVLLPVMDQLGFGFLRASQLLSEALSDNLSIYETWNSWEIYGNLWPNSDEFQKYVFREADLFIE